MQNIGEVFFFSPGPSSDLINVARLTTPTGKSAHDDESHETGNPGCRNTIV